MRHRKDLSVPSADSHAPRASHGSVDEKYGHPAEVAEFVRRAAGGLDPAETLLVERHLEPDWRLLDVGCAAGRLALALDARGHRVTAVDRCVAMLRSVPHEAPNGVCWVQADAQRLPFAAGVFDAALLLDQFIDQFHGRQVRVELLRSAARLVRPGGVVLASTHNRIWTPGVGRLAWMAWRRVGASRTQIRARTAGRSRIGGQRTEVPADQPAVSRSGAALLKRVLAAARGRVWVHRTNLWRRSARVGPHRRHTVAEPGDFWLDHVSGANSPGCMSFHHYDYAEFLQDVRRAGLHLQCCYEPLELERRATAPGWVRRNAPLLYWVLVSEPSRLQ